MTQNEISINMEPCLLQSSLTKGSAFDVAQSCSPVSAEESKEFLFSSSSAVGEIQDPVLRWDRSYEIKGHILPCLTGSIRVFDTYEHVQEFIFTEEKATGMHFVGHRKEGIFDRIGGDLKAFIGEGRKHIRYCNTVGTKGRGYDPIPVEYTGVPFIEAGTYVMECHMGNDSGIWIKKRYAEKRQKLEKDNNQCVLKRRTRTIGTKKAGCPAKIHIKRILRLIDFKIDKNTVEMKERNRMKIMKAVKNDLHNVKFEHKYYILIPSLESHQFHAVDLVAGIMVSKTKNNELHLHQIKHYLETGIYLPSVTPNEKKSIRVAAKLFHVEESSLYYIGEEGVQRCIVLYATHEKQKAFDECHVMHKSGEHLDCSQTLQLLKLRYYWLGMAEDIVEMAQQCHVCKLQRDCSIIHMPTFIKNEEKKTGSCKLQVRGSRKRNVSFKLDIEKKRSAKIKVEPTNIAVDLKKTQVDNFTWQRKSSNDKHSSNADQQGKESLEILYTFQDAIHFIKEEEKATGMQYVGHRKEGAFDKEGHNLKAFVKSGRKHIRYCISKGAKGRGYDPVPVKYTGVPFIEAGTYVMECHLGTDSGIWNKNRYAALRDKIQEEKYTVIKRRCRMYKTKKMGCPAKVHIKRILRMPCFKIHQNTRANREKNRKKIMCAIKENMDSINFQTEYYVLMPDLDSHKFHTVDTVAGVLVLKGESGSQYLSQVRHYLQTGTHAQSVPMYRKKSIRKSAQEFVMDDGVMYYQGKSTCERRFVPATEEEKLKAFKEAHILKSGQHLNKEETIRRLSESCYWIDLLEDAQSNFNLCPVCRCKKYTKHDLQFSLADSKTYKIEDKYGFNILCENVAVDNHLPVQGEEEYLNEKTATATTVHKMSDGGSLVVIASNCLNLERESNALGRESIINIFDENKSSIKNTK